MNHPMYQEWLFSQEDEPLDMEQQLALQAHLAECKECSALAEAWVAVDRQLRAMPQSAPMAGFTSRWQDRLLMDRQRAYRRQTILTLGFYGLGFLVLTGLAIFFFWPWLRSPQALWWSWLYHGLVFVSLADSLGEFLRTLLLASLQVIPTIGWLLIFGLICEAAVLWVVSFQMLTNPRRVTK